MNVPHAFLTLNGEPGHVVYDLTNPVHVVNLLSEIKDMSHDWSGEDPLWTIEVAGRPKGFTDTLEEFQGW